MSNNKGIVEIFFKAFSEADYRQMSDCYADDIIYSDPVFGLMQGDDVRKMWQMICKGARNLSVQYSGIEELDEMYVTCLYKVSYYFELTQKHICYSAKAFMKIEEGKITEHSDGYRLSSFISNAYGIKGKLLSWSGYMKKSVQNRYRTLLQNFASTNN